MDIQLFQTFLAVAKLGNMTQAASRLNFTQPAVTGQIRALDEYFALRIPPVRNRIPPVHGNDTTC